MNNNTEQNTNQVTTQANTITTTDTKKSRSNVLMLLILVVLFAIYGILIYGIKMSNEVDYITTMKLENVSNLDRPVVNRLPTPSPQEQIEGIDSIDVGDVDTELQDLNADVQGL